MFFLFGLKPPLLGGRNQILGGIKKIWAEKWGGVFCIFLCFKTQKKEPGKKRGFLRLGPVFEKSRCKTE
ncbi:hypothetical protein M5086_10620, partial [Neisseria meningitidis]|nr:hypothetical protein [Neisseria meningitidis]